jgi:hypothetical protein
VLWKVAKVSNATAWLHLLVAIGGSDAGAMTARTFEVEAWPDGLLVTGSMDGNRWVAWADVAGIGPPPPSEVDSGGVWVEVVLDEGAPVRLGQQHLLGDGDDAIAEAEEKTQRLRSAWTAWWAGAWPPS